jgi:sugar lactone lactonase YvrE
MTAIDIAIREPFILGESPVWDPDFESLWFVDIRAPAIHRYTPSAIRHHRWLMPELVGCIALRATGGLVVGLQNGFHFFDPGNGALTPFAPSEPEKPRNRPNDAKCDRAGRFWVGTMEDYGTNAAGTMYVIDAALRPQPRFGGFTVPNSITFSSDSARFTFTDTRGAADILVHDYDTEAGVIGASRVLLPRNAAPGLPDGSTLDAEGCLWNARYGGGAVVRVTPQGRVDRIIELPTKQITACVFGGKDLDELYITSAAQRLTPAELAAQPEAGCVFVCRPGVTGVPDAKFVG